jgi:type VI secretion system secreted protein VgrG
MTDTQDTREMKIVCDGFEGTNVIVHRMNYYEELSRPFQLDVDLLVDSDDFVDFENVVGMRATLSLLMRGTDFETAKAEDIRHFNGVVVEVGQGGRIYDKTEYHLRIAPDLWMLTYRKNCRIFQNRTVPQILKAVCEEQYITDIEERISRECLPRQHCVQYRETDFDFLSRLLEEEGIYYYFSHRDGEHTLVLCDDSSATDPVPGFEEIPFGLQADESIVSFEARQRVKSGEYKLRDYDFRMDDLTLETEATPEWATADSDLSVTDYPGSFTEDTYGDEAGSSIAEDLTKIRMEECLNGVWEAEGRTASVAGLSAGFKFQLLGHPRADWDEEYLVSRVDLSSTLDTGRAQASFEGKDAAFHCSFTAHPVSGDQKWQYRPRRQTPKPRIAGLQTARVVGEPGEEIWTDEHARVQVAFHWDEEKGEENTCWVRVAQMMTGVGFGTLFIPRIDSEVVVSFLEGDPDRPLIVGTVYNGTNTPSVTLPDDKTQSTLHTESSPGGGGFNELRFEDKADEEEIYLHAQKDMVAEIGNDRTTTIGNDEKFEIKNNREGEVAENETLTVKGDRERTVDKKETVTVGESRTKTVGTEETIDVGTDLTETIGAGQTTDVGTELTISAGTKITFKVGGSEIVIDSTTIKLKTGMSTVELGADAVKIQSLNAEVKGDLDLKLEGGLSAKLKGGMSASLEGLMVDVKGDAKASLKGAVSMIG